MKYVYTYSFAGLLLFATAATAQNQQQNQQPPNQQTTGQRDRMDPTNEAARSDMLANRVESRLARSMSLYGSDIDVKAAGRTTTLTGVVPDEQAKERAERIARRTAGVSKVENQLRIDKAAVDQRRNVNAPDEQLAKQVAQKIAQTLEAEAEEDWAFGWEVEDGTWEIEVDADGGVITLSGDAESYADMNTAVMTARDIPGVRSVINEMTLSWESRRYGDEYGYGYPYHYGYPYYTPMH